MRTERARAAGREALLWLWAAIAAGIVLRLLVFRGSGFPSDVGTFMAWAERLASVGPAKFYDPAYFSDYPPGFLYVLWLVGALFDGEALRLVVKLLSLPADIAVALLLYRVVRRAAGPMTGALTGALWMLQPGPIFAGPFWGQVDSWGTFPFLAALVAAGERRWIFAGVLAAVATMVKPQFGLAAIVVGAAALVELVRFDRRRPFAEVVVAGVVTAVVLAVPFGLTPSAFVDLVRSASETYQYSSLYAFNVWAIVLDFWKPDAQWVVFGGFLLVMGIVASLVPLWWRRDTPMLLAVGAFAAMAFYFLPTRAHERYVFPVFALLAPFALTRGRILLPYVVMAMTFFATLYFAFTRYPQSGLTAPPLVETTLFSRNGQILLALLMMGSAAVLVWRLARGEAEFRSTIDVGLATPVRVAVSSRPWQLPPGLGRGHAPTRRDIAVAILVALAVVATRGSRLDWPRDMYFDEVYHARTAFELLAQREPYEWTHPHLAKEIMALGELAFGGDRVESREDAPRGATAFAVSSDGVRAYGFADGRVDAGPGRQVTVEGPVRALAFDNGLFALTDKTVTNVGLLATGGIGPVTTRPLGAPPTAFAVSGIRAIVGTAGSVEIHVLGSDAAPLRLPFGGVAITTRPDSTDVFVADTSGTIHQIDASTGRETGRLSGGGPVASLAYTRDPDRVYAGRAGEAAIDWYEPRHGDQAAGTYGGVIALSNDRTGALGAPVSAMAVVPRTQFLYALTGDHLVVVETHGASPFASITVRGTMLGVDGIGDRLAVAGDGTVEWIPTGRHAFAWRVPGVLFGALLAFFVVLLARRLFASPLVPLFAGAAVVLDGAMFAQARIGMNDVYVGAFLVAGWYFVVAAHAPRRSAAVDLVIAGILFGLAAASKWAAFYALAGLGLLAVVATAYAWGRERPGTGGPFDLLAHRGDALAARLPARTPAALRRTVTLFGRGAPNAFFLLLCFAVVPVLIYVASYARWFGGPTIPYGWDLVDLTKQMYWYHSGLTAPHPAGSPWWSWPLVLKPVYWYLGSPGGGATAVIYDAGNVVLFWGALVAFGWAVVAAIRARSLALAFLVFALLTQYVAWIPITRVLFFYHFFTALPFYFLILAAALVALWETGRRRLVAAYLALATAAFVFFYPFISGQPVPADQAAVFYVLPTWQYDCQFYPSFHCDAAFRGEIPIQAVLGRIAIAAGVALLAVGGAFALQERASERVRALVARFGPRRPETP